MSNNQWWIYNQSTSVATADVLSRLKLGKTLFGNQLFRIGITDTPSCTTCYRELGTEISENIIHATYDCTFVSAIIREITKTFFPNAYCRFFLRDIILATTTTCHPLYECTTGRQLMAVIWDIFLYYIIKCRSLSKTPTAPICLHEMHSQLNRILKILPNSKISHHIRSTPQIQCIINPVPQSQ